MTLRWYHIAMCAAALVFTLVVLAQQEGSWWDIAVCGFQWMVPL